MIASKLAKAPPDPDSCGDFVHEDDTGNGLNESSAVNPEDSIPDLPENLNAREFLRKAPKQGLHMPLGKEVKVMQCWRCKAYGHRTGDRECPLRLSGNLSLERARTTREDPMLRFVREKELRRQEKYARVEQLMLMVEEIREEEAERKRRKEIGKAEKRTRKEHRVREKDEQRSSKRRKKDGSADANPS